MSKQTPQLRSYIAKDPKPNKPFSGDTLRRIADGVERYLSKQPFIINLPKGKGIAVRVMELEVKFGAEKRVFIPKWANTIFLHRNSIDGVAPAMPTWLSVGNFLKEAENLQLRPGSGEWDVLIYATNDQYGVRTTAPYGASNPYRRLRSGRKGCRVRLLATFSYMRHYHYTFKK